MGDIVNFTGTTCLDLPPERILNGALKEDLDTAVVIGYTKDGDFYFASSASDGGDVNWLLDLAKHQLIKIGLNEDE